MNYSVIYDPIDNIIIATVHGDVELGSISKMLVDIVKQMKETGCEYLINDMRNARLKMTLMDIIAIPGILQTAALSREVDLKNLRRALVSGRRPEMVEMQEVLTRYIGSTFQHFQTIEEAKLWLIDSRDQVQT